MSSDNSNTHPDYDPNIKIKAEPNTEPATPTVNPAIPIINPVIPNLNVNIKTEPGLPLNRLPSLKPPRDYTLGGANMLVNIKSEKPKKVFTPNLNVQRNKNREDANTSKKSEPRKSDRGLDRRKNDKSKDKGRGRGKAANNYVQSSGIFSEGLADISTRRHTSSIYRDRESSGSIRESTAMLERPKLSIPIKINKAEEDEKLRDLRRDDFIDDDLDVDMENTPVSLPMIYESSSQKVNLVKENDEIPMHLQNGNAATHSKIKPSASYTDVKEAKLPVTVPQVMENTSNNFILIQLPDCLPGLQVDDNDARPTRVKSEPSVENETDKSNKFCTLNSLKEGMLGKLQILRSGKARLILGENDLIVDVGSNISFRQDLIAAYIKDDKQSGDLVNLGKVNSTLICSPDWENMLKAL